jgi:hypothetical protein
VVLASLIDDRHDFVEEALDGTALGLGRQLPLAAAVDAENPHRASLVHQRQVVAGADGEAFGQLPGESAGECGHILHLRLLLGHVDARDEKVGGVDRKGLLANCFGLQTGDGGTGEAAAGEVFQVDAGAVHVGDEVDRLQRHVQDVFDVLLAVVADLLRQYGQAGYDG